ncbi:Beta-lactamase [Alcanivorax sp. 521-1]|uniref:Beta-lactamase n=2 Tax=Alloalcanivorax profundimaris TaxID=2735259 RepID=A0ABS0AVM4_9GAMM|nr:class A beta-lactamase [Alloalcanivorax profundimaris]MBF5058167.1 Beta-lactamase [Alloalcanivorax profundimaris]
MSNNRSRVLEVVVCAGLLVMMAVSAARADDAVIDTVKQVENRLQARVGVAVSDQGGDRTWRHNADQRFPLASTFKVLVCGALLHKVDAGDESLDRVIHYGEADLVTYSPATGEHVDTGMTLGELCEAAVTLSDNTAANLVLDAIGGPAGLTRFLRGTGDNVTRLDRREPELNEATPGDPRDTTTPDAMLASLRALVFGDVLSESSRQQLLQWMKNDKIADALLRAGIPDDWTIGDKTGAGGHGSRAIIAVMWPPQRGPVLAAIYITETDASMDQRNAAIADIGRALAAAVAR